MSHTNKGIGNHLLHHLVIFGIKNFHMTVLV
jgi:hypothetical protein